MTTLNLSFTQTFKQPMAKLLPMAATVLLCACGGGGGSSNSSNSSNAGNATDNTIDNNDSIAAQYQGTWLAEAYGSAFKIEGDSLAL